MVQLNEKALIYDQVNISMDKYSTIRSQIFKCQRQVLKCLSERKPMLHRISGRCFTMILFSVVTRKVFFDLDHHQDPPHLTSFVFISQE